MAQSKIVGKADAGGAMGQAYEALAPLQCFSCGEAIPVGGLFTRQGYPSGGSATYPTCQQCYPFQLIVPEKQQKLKRLLPVLALPDGQQMKAEPRALDALAQLASLYGEKTTDQIAERALNLARAEKSTKLGNWHVRRVEWSMRDDLLAVLLPRGQRPGKAGADQFYQTRVKGA